MLIRPALPPFYAGATPCVRAQRGCWALQRVRQTRLDNLPFCLLSASYLPSGAHLGPRVLICGFKYTGLVGHLKFQSHINWAVRHIRTVSKDQIWGQTSSAGAKEYDILLTLFSPLTSLYLGDANTVAPLDNRPSRVEVSRGKPKKGACSDQAEGQ